MIKIGGTEMKKRWIALFLAAMTVSLAACGNSGGSAAKSGAPAASGTVDSSAAEGGSSGAVQASADPSDWPVIRAEVSAFTDTLEQKDAVQDALNQYLVSINAGVQCEMVPLAFGDRSTQLTLMLTDADNPIDLFGWRFYSSVSDLVKNGQIISLEKYRDVYPDLWKLYPETVYKTCQINGEQYSMPGADSFGNYQVYALRKDLAKEIGVDNLAGTKITREQYEDILAKAEAAHPEMAWEGETMVWPYMNVDNLGDTNALGVLPDMGVDQDKIINYYSSDEFKDYVEMCKGWADKGYIIDDPLNTQRIGTTLVTNNQIGGYMFEAYNIEYAESLMQAQIPDYEMDIFQLTDPHCTNSCVYTGWNISSICKNPDAAMKLLSLMMTDENVSRFFTLGVKGLTYVVDDKGIARYPEGKDANTDGWNLGAPWFYPNQCLSIPFNTDYTGYYTDMKACWTDPNMKYSKAMGFIFDTTPVYDQYTACTAIVAEYRDALMLGQVDVDEYLAKFNDELNKAGIDQVIAEMQKQYDAFLQENGK